MADYQAIIDAIDAAVASWVGEPVSIGGTFGENVTYRSLESLIKARKYYASLKLQSTKGRGFTLSSLKASGVR